MPSGITHMLLSMGARSQFSDSLQDVIDANLGAFLAGSVAPDLPYAAFAGSVLDAGTAEVADLFHYQKTNQIPLHAMAALPQGNHLREAFAFFAGYISHIVGDGVGHPFIRDKVGDYALHKNEHRALEMKLDVLYCRTFFSVNLKEAGMEFPLSVWHAAGRSAVLNMFSSLIESVYARSIAGSQIQSWIDGLRNLLAAAAGVPLWYGPLASRGLAYFDYHQLQAQKADISTLRMPIDAALHHLTSNFAGRTIEFFKDCVPRHAECLKVVLEKAHEAAFAGGTPLSAEDLPAINLDTGRLLAQSDGNDLSKKPFFWI